MKLTDQLEDIIVINGKEYRIDMSFDNILKIYELKDDKDLTKYAKVDLMFRMLIIEHDELKNLDINKKSKVVDFILNNYLYKPEENDLVEEHISSDMEGNVEEKPKKVYDFVVDAERIYASFMKEYGIDLIEEQGKLHWKKFISLLNNLSAESPFMQVVQIRTKPLPTGKYSQEERTRLAKLKQKYSLEKGSESINEQLDKAAKILVSKAVRKVGDKK